jgi:AcrR family transcriptional regulator
MFSEKQNMITRAAEKRFIRHGLAKTTMEEIARDLRISKATLYHYFKNKEEIYYAVADQESDKFIEEASEIFLPEDKSYTDKIIEYFALKSEVPEKYPLMYELMRYIFRENPPESDTAALVRLFDKEEKFLTDRLKPLIGRKKALSGIPSFLMRQSWGLLFTRQLDKLAGRESTYPVTDILQETYGILTENID